MAGELWNGVVYVGKEVTPGTAVTVTRKLYLTDPKLSREREGRKHRFATGTRDNVRQHTNGPIVAAGSATQMLSSSEIIEFLLSGIKAGVTPTSPNAGVYLWTFVLGNTLETMTTEWHDGARPWRGTGYRVESINFSGSAGGENVVTYDLFGLNLAQFALSATPGDRVPVFHEGWETKMYITSFGGTPGAGLVAGTLLNWDITISNQLGRKYFADNTNTTGGVSIGEIEIDATLTFEAAPAAALTEFTNWDAGTKRLIRLEWGQNEVIASTYKRYVSIDIPGAWNAVDLGGDDEGTRTYELGYHYVYDPTNAFGLQIIAQNDRSAAWT